LFFEKTKVNKMWLNPTILKKTNVQLVPLESEHKAGLLKAASDGELWNLWFTSVPNEKSIDGYVAFALEEQAKQRALPFTIFVDDKIVGSTRYCNAEPKHRRLEIGYTWYAKSYQKTGVNTACKYLLLEHAFEKLNCIAVEFRTHWYNEASRKAIARLGAKQDGVLRNHRLDKDGCLRDTVVFSIIKEEWNTVKKSLEYKMNFV